MVFLTLPHFVLSPDWFFAFLRRAKDGQSTEREIAIRP